MLDRTTIAGLKNSRVVLASFPNEVPVLANFRLEQVPVPRLGPGEVLFETRHVSVDAHMRSHDSCCVPSEPSLHIGSVIEADGVAEVLASNDPNFHPGNIVLGRTGWQTHHLLCGKLLRKLDLTELPQSTALAVLGTPAFTAYSALRGFAKPRPTETLVVPAALSPIGAITGQLARMAGLWTVGIVSGPEEARFALEQLGFHTAVDYTRTGSSDALRHACPKGIDIFVETVGGAFWKQVRPLLNRFARVVLTGTRAQYGHRLGGAAEYESPVTMQAILSKSLTIGAVSLDSTLFDAFVGEMTAAIRNGSLSSRVHIIEGLGRAAETWLTAIDGPNYGTKVIQVSLSPERVQ